MDADDPLIPKHGGFRRLKSFQVAELVFDVTVRFCDKYVDRRSRTHDQMVQAARSGSRNITEGSQASGTSKKAELILTNVARSSLEELRGDYEAILRQQGLPQWERHDPRRDQLVKRRPKTADDVAEWARWVWKSGRSGPSGLSGQDRGSQGTSMPAPENSMAGSTSSTWSTSSTPSYLEITANGALALIGVATYLLDRQLASLADSFERDGGFSERLYQHRRKHREY